MSHILFTYITPFHPLRGGIGRVTDTLTRALQSRGHRVYYLIYRSALTEEHVYDYPAPLFYLPSSELCSEENVSFYHRFLAEHKIDIVINQSGNFEDSELWTDLGGHPARIVSVLHSEPWVGYLHLWHEQSYLRNGTWLEKLKRIARIVLYFRTKKRYRASRVAHFSRLLPRTDVVCTLSSRYFEQITEICPGYEGKYYAIPNPNSYTDEELKPYRNIPKRKQVVCVGLLVGNKRVDRLITVWKRLWRDFPDWELVIIGYGKPEYEALLKSQARGCETIRFVGEQDPRPYYASASILCHPSNYEGWGLVITEAMQLGAVPMAFDASAVYHDIIDNGVSGYLVPPYNLRIFERKLRELMADDALRAEMSRKAREQVKQFSVEQVIHYWLTLIGELSKI